MAFLPHLRADSRAPLTIRYSCLYPLKLTSLSQLCICALSCFIFIPILRSNKSVSSFYEEGRFRICLSCG